MMCDIEGAERELLDPDASPALKGMDIIVESHECLIQGITQLLIDRFKATHHITPFDHPHSSLGKLSAKRLRVKRGIH
jgi:hypothetical protein